MEGLVAAAYICAKNPSPHGVCHSKVSSKCALIVRKGSAVPELYHGKVENLQQKLWLVFVVGQ